jgi:hypothetical protein
LTYLRILLKDIVADCRKVFLENLKSLLDLRLRDLKSIEIVINASFNDFTFFTDNNSELMPIRVKTRFSETSAVFETLLIPVVTDVKSSKIILDFIIIFL